MCSFEFCTLRKYISLGDLFLFQIHKACQNLELFLKCDRLPRTLCPQKYFICNVFIMVYDIWAFIYLLFMSSPLGILCPPLFTKHIFVLKIDSHRQRQIWFCWISSRHRRNPLHASVTNNNERQFLLNIHMHASMHHYRFYVQAVIVIYNSAALTIIINMPNRCWYLIMEYEERNVHVFNVIMFLLPNNAEWHETNVLHFISIENEWAFRIVYQINNDSWNSRIRKTINKTLAECRTGKPNIQRQTNQQ